MLLLEVLHLYGRSFNYNEVAVTVREGGGFLGREEVEAVGRGPGVLVVENPLREGVDMAGGSFRMEQVAADDFTLP